MSLPDTVFIFVLALIIFGPKKLPEIGRQLGKLVGEFRRASNEFKFQIEEELRQADLADRNTIAHPSKELDSSASGSSSSDGPPSPLPDQPYPEETLPVGQYPNIDTVNPDDLDPQNPEPAQPEAAQEIQAVAEDASISPSITPAVGSEPRATHPYAAPAAAVTPADAVSAPVDPAPRLEPPAGTNHAQHAANATPLPNHEPADPYAAPAVVDVTHG
ncbi:MAG: Sec-independent protein translocase subunit TatA/TatB [Acidobacteriaceae bacterium]